MTDREKLLALLNEWGVPCKEKRDRTTGSSIAIEDQSSAKVTGYNYFYTAFEFDEAGNFKCVGAWE